MQLYSISEELMMNYYQSLKGIMLPHMAGFTVDTLCCYSYAFLIGNRLFTSAIFWDFSTS